MKFPGVNNITALEKNESEHGTDVIAYRFFTDEKKPHKNDELVAIEVKALLSSKEAGKVIKDAVDDSKKDEHRVSHGNILCRYIVCHCYGGLVQVIVEPSAQVF